MGKDSGFGNALINSCRRQKRRRADRYEQTGETAEPPNAKQALQSVTARDGLSDFLYNAELTQQRFENLKEKKLLHGEKLIFQTRPPPAGEAAAQLEALRALRFLRIPRKPRWQGKSAEEQKRDEAVGFVHWRRQLAELELSAPNCVLTPYEKNLEVWRQLWHVVEKAAIVFQIVDARDYAFFRCEDLEDFVRGFGGKSNFLILNKADLLPPAIVACLSAHLRGLGLPHAFFSAKAQLELLEAEEAAPAEPPARVEADCARVLSRAELLALLQQLAAGVLAQAQPAAPAPAGEDCAAELLRGLSARRPAAQAVFGMVGFPNVGKSSLINALLGRKKVGVGCRPGKTKNYQTVRLSAEAVIFDCPGLVFPSALFSKWKMVFNGVLPIDNLTEHVAPVEYLLQRVPTQFVLELYQLPFRVPRAGSPPAGTPGAELAEDPLEFGPNAHNAKLRLEDEDVNLAFRLTARELLQIFASTRGLVTGAGVPDEAKAAKQILRDCVEGKLPHFELPEEYQSVVDEEFRRQIKKAFNPHKIPLKNVRKADLLVEEKRSIVRNGQQRLEEENLLSEKKNRVQHLLEGITESKILDLIEGKKVDGFCIDKDNRRTLKHMIKGDAKPEETLSELKKVLIGKKQPK